MISINLYYQIQTKKALMKNYGVSFPKHLHHPKHVRAILKTGTSDVRTIVGDFLLLSVLK
jgi:hypothetical protein